MNIRTKLFIFIPILVVLLNLVSFFIYQSGKTVQESYNLMMNRILLYKQISQEVQENLRYLSRYLINQDKASYAELLNHKDALAAVKKDLAEEEKKESNDLAIKNYDNMIETFIEQEGAVLSGLNPKSFTSYVLSYEEAEKTAGYIREDGQNLVDLELSFYQPIYREIMLNTEIMHKFALSLFVVTTLLSIVFAIWLSHSITNPIERLVQTAKQISKGNLNVEASPVRTNDEIGILCETFNQMLKNLRELISKNMEMLEKDRLVKELELKALQSQINPHFLFNTLNVISKLAYIEGAEQTSELTVSTSNLLRYNLRKLDRPVTLRDEVEHAKEYFAIQKARFRDRVTFITSIDEEALNQSIPCLTLQPIIENAFVHGIEGMEQGAVLKLVIKNNQDHVRIEIADNGEGMSEETRVSLLDQRLDRLPASVKGQSTGLGTGNVFKRLHLFYGTQNLIEIESKKNEGTTVIFTLPKKKEEGDQHVSFVNSG